jgi:hypothetical protein
MEQNDVLAEPAHPLDGTGGDRRTEYAGLHGLQSHELRYTLAAGYIRTELMRLAGW